MAKILGLYVHIPFCRQKCFYCDFFSLKYDTVLADAYIDALIQDALRFKDKKIHSIYIGGGTPSVLSLGQICKFLQALVEIFNFSEVSEFTFELNPESTSKEKLHILRNFGVTRLSLGLQSVEDKTLTFLGRMHDFNSFCEIYNVIREEEFNNINIDLIYGFPFQTIKKFEMVLKRVLLFNSEHLSIYPLSVEKGTSFYKDGIVTNDDIQRDIYDKTVEILEKNGYIHYEISNWSKKDKESLHNSNYWCNFEYIGIGAGASGYLGRRRYKNIENIKKYIELSLSLQNERYGDDNSTLLEIESEYINDELYKIERIMLGLRLLNKGVDSNCFNNHKHRSVLLKCLKNGTLELDNGRIKLSKESVFIFNQIVSKFMR
ncbi:MAG: radical SAM family heme chaperone HemW [Endomicrobium sp.]|jgi:oxygen-independent coproporphyrinogen-3 oxidase|nr:radical SAM family heme chaperone HemW [Endomicrobium sp.]